MAPPVDPILAGEVAARTRQLEVVREGATLCGDLARGVRAGHIEPGSGVVQGLEAMKAGLLALLASEQIRLYRDEAAIAARPVVATTLRGRARWLLTGR